MEIPNMAENRFARGKERLMLSEQLIQKDRTISRRLGRALPEEAIKVPIIGEWSLNDDDIIDHVRVPSPGKPHSRMNTVAGSRSDSRKASRPATAFTGPPCSIRAPRVNTADMTPTQGCTTFAPGTVTTDLNDILRSKYRAQKKPLPPLKSHDEVNNDPLYLPLEMFDDSTYEQYPVEELLKEPEAYSRYQDLYGTNSWAHCTVVGYDPETRVFTIEWDGTRTRKRVARFNLRFEKEDPDLFERRVEEAKRSCARYESMLRFESRVSEMPTSALPLLSASNMEAIHERMGMDVPRIYRSILNGMDDEIAMSFQRTNNRLD
jgi:hypothetical protein